MKNKKKIILLGSIALALALLLGGGFAYIQVAKTFHTGDLTGTAAAYSIEGRAIAPMTVDSNGDFTILQFTDTHLVSGQSAKDRKTLAAIDAFTARVNPDLVVVSGDMLEGRNAKLVVDKEGALRAIADIFARREQLWAYVPGNNDGEYLGSSADVCAYLAQNYENCLLSNEPGLTGAVQYAIPLLYEDGAAAHALVFMDSLARDPATSYITYACMAPDQADWLRARLLALKAAEPLARASVFFHMDTPAFHGGMGGNEIIDEAMADAGNVGLVSIGHLHPSETFRKFEGRTYYQVVRASGYFAARRPGAVKITIHCDDGSPERMYSFEDIAFS